MKGYTIGRKVFYGLAGLGTGYLAYKTTSSEDGLDIYNIGVARFGRAAFAVSNQRPGGSPSLLHTY